MSIARPTAPLWRVIISFIAIYFLWGGSFLAIRVSLETIPPLMISFIRFTCGGIILMTVAWRSGAKKPTWAQWRSAAVLGFLMFFAANSTLVLGEKTVPSGLAAVLYATLPLWMAIIGWLWQGEERPAGRSLMGLVLGFIGVVLMFGTGGSGIDPIGGLLVLGSAIFWAVGSLLSRQVDKPESMALASGMNLFCSGMIFLLISVIAGEPSQLNVAAVSLESALSVGYLIVGSSVIAFSCYMWLMSVTTPNRVATYAYVNPVVALFIGAVAGETLNPRELIAALVIVVAVALITSAHAKSTAEDSPIAEGSVRSKLKALAGWGTGFMTSGYSGKPLATKMGIKPGQRIIILHAPDGYQTTLGTALDDVELAHELGGTFDLIQYFATERSAYERDFPLLRDALTTAGMLWVSWPKKAAKMVTDLDENFIREFGLVNGLVDVKVIAVDERWSGLKFVRRLKDR